MQYLNCHKNASRVIDSRPTDEGKTIRGCRECENCGHRFTTSGHVEQAPLSVIENDGIREPFDREKILRGVAAAAQKRQVTSEQLDKLVDHVENKIRKQGVSETSSKEIGGLVVSELVNVDDVVYIRFASIYRQFQDIFGFMKTMKDIMDKHEHSNQKRSEIDV